MEGEFSSDPKTVKPVSVFLEKGGVEINCTVCHLSSLSVERLQKEGKETFTFLHLADAFITVYRFILSVCVEPTTICTVNAMLYH